MGWDGTGRDQVGWGWGGVMVRHLVYGVSRMCRISTEDEAGSRFCRLCSSLPACGPWQFSSRVCAHYPARLRLDAHYVLFYHNRPGLNCTARPHPTCSPPMLHLHRGVQRGRQGGTGSVRQVAQFVTSNDKNRSEFPQQLSATQGLTIAALSAALSAAFGVARGLACDGTWSCHTRCGTFDYSVLKPWNGHCAPPCSLCRYAMRM